MTTAHHSASSTCTVEAKERDALQKKSYLSVDYHLNNGSIEPLLNLKVREEVATARHTGSKSVDTGSIGANKASVKTGSKLATATEASGRVWQAVATVRPMIRP